MKKKFSVAGLVFVALCTMAATIQWYSQQPATTTLTDSMVIAVERPVPHGYLSTTLASLKGYTGTNTVLVSSNVYTTNLYTTNLYSSNVFTTNLFSTNVYTTNLYSSNAFITNITVNNITSQTNYFTDLTVESNVTFNGKVTINNITVTNGITNLNLTANTIVKADANSALASVPNGSGALTNDGSGNFGWSALSGGDQVWTNDAGTARLVSGGATNIDASPYFTLGSIAEDYAVGNYEILVGHDAALSGIVNFDQIWEMASDPTFTNDTYIQFSLGQTPVSGSIWMSSTDGIATNRSYQFNIQMSPTGGNNWIKYQTNYTDIWVVDGNGVVTANAYETPSLNEGSYVAVGPSGRLINTNPPTGGDQVWTNDTSTLKALGLSSNASVRIQTNGGILVGNYYGLNNDAFSLNGMSDTESNCPPTWELMWGASYNKGSGVYSKIVHTGVTNLAGDLYASSSLYNYGNVDNVEASLVTVNANGVASKNAAQRSELVLKDGRGDEINLKAGGVDTTGTGFWIKTNSTYVLRVNSNGVVTANAYIVTEYAWSGPTNEIGIGEFKYTANEPCAVTNLTTTGSALLSITNASSSNITFTVYSPIRIPYGETSRSYTITNGDVFFGSFRKGAHGSAFVPRGFWQP